MPAFLVAQESRAQQTTQPLTAAGFSRCLIANPMDWYYVDAGQQAGPVNDAQLEALASRGTILNDTLVWREGMDNWRMYGEVKAPGSGPLLAPPIVAPAPPTLAPGQAVCAECGRVFNVPEMISYARHARLRRLQAGLHAETRRRRHGQHRRAELCGVLDSGWGQDS